MSAAMLAIAPVFVLIVLGYCLRRGGIPTLEFWNLNDKLVYWVLMPALFFSKISAADLGGDMLWRFGGVLYFGFFTAVAFGWLIGRKMPDAVATSTLQGTARYNSFVVLAIIEALLGNQGLQIAVLGSALLIPVVNIVIVSMMAVRLSAERKHGILYELARNPLIISIGAGVAFNLTGFGEVPVLHECARILGAAALPIMLLCVGANLKLRGLQLSAVRIGLCSIGKLVVFPAAVVVGLLVSPLDAVATQVAIIFAATPTSSNAYTLARQMGGDAPLMAAIVTIQTLLSFLTLPLTLYLAGMLLF